MFISLQRRRRWVGKPRATPGHPQNKGRVVLLKSGTEAKLLPPGKGGNRGGPVAWSRVSGLQGLSGVLWVWYSVCPTLGWGTNPNPDPNP